MDEVAEDFIDKASKEKPMSTELVTLEHIRRFILLVRGKKVLLDEDLAGLYGVRTGNLNKAVKRNSERFPDDFMFQLTKEEYRVLLFQNGTTKPDRIETRGGRKMPPYAFTEQGVAMLSSVLNSPRAIVVNISIMRAFVQLRLVMENNPEIAKRLSKMEKKQEQHDQSFQVVFKAISELMKPPAPRNKKRIGF